MKYSDIVKGKSNYAATNQRLGGGAQESNENMSELKDILKELKEINEILDLGKFIQLLKQLKNELKQCSNTTDKLMVMLRYIEIFD